MYVVGIGTNNMLINLMKTHSWRFILFWWMIRKKNDKALVYFAIKQDFEEISTMI